MPKRIEPIEAIEVLQEAMVESEALEERKLKLAEYANEVLRTRGDLVVVQNGMFGGIEGLIGSAKRGVHLMQATRPTQLDSVYTALRDKDSEQSGEIELIFARTGDPDEVFMVHDEGVAATLTIGGALYLPNTKKPTKTQIDSVEAVISHINSSIEPIDINTAFMKLPSIETGSFSVSAGNGVHELTEIVARKTQAARSILGRGPFIGSN